MNTKKRARRRAKKQPRYNLVYLFPPVYERLRVLAEKDKRRPPQMVDWLVSAEVERRAAAGVVRATDSQLGS